MTASRVPAGILILAALTFAVWGVVLLATPGGSVTLEWAQLVMAVLLLAFGVVSLRSADTQRADLIRWLLVAFAVFGAVVVIGLTADDSSSRTWVRLGWAALVFGSVGAFVAWWTAPRVNKVLLMTGGVLALVVIAGGLGITLNCDKSLQRSWCDPLFEQEEAVARRVEVAGVEQRAGRSGGNTGAALIAYFIEGDSIVEATRAPEGFVYTERPIQSTEVERGRYEAVSGPDSNCVIDVKLEQVPQGNLETVTVRCEDA